MNILKISIKSGIRGKYAKSYREGSDMVPTVEALDAGALQLSVSERVRLAERLIASLGIETGVEEAWAAEVEGRNAEIESGAVSLVHGPEALAKLKSEFR